MIEPKLCRESLNPRGMVQYVKFRMEFAGNHPDYFYPDGLCIFVGGQGTGKTLSAVNYVYKLLAAYPKCILVTNVKLTDFPFDGQRVFLFEDNDDFSKYANGECGVIFFVDEIQLYLNSLQSRNINMDVVTQISQQRKQRVHIVATSQVFGRMAKPLREQFNTVILCTEKANCLQINYWVDRDSIESADNSATSLTGKVREKFVWWRTPEMFERYDTSEVIRRKKWASGEKQMEVYVDGAGRVCAGI